MVQKKQRKRELYKLCEVSTVALFTRTEQKAHAKTNCYTAIVHCIQYRMYGHAPLHANTDVSDRHTWSHQMHTVKQAYVCKIPLRQTYFSETDQKYSAAAECAHFL